ncbi:hypothetical protein, partial [Staphylococcus caeli]
KAGEEVEEGKVKAGEEVEEGEIKAGEEVEEGEIKAGEEVEEGKVKASEEVEEGEIKAGEEVEEGEVKADEEVEEGKVKADKEVGKGEVKAGEEVEEGKVKADKEVGKKEDEAKTKPLVKDNVFVNSNTKFANTAFRSGKINAIGLPDVGKMSKDLENQANNILRTLKLPQINEVQKDIENRISKLLKAFNLPDINAIRQDIEGRLANLQNLSKPEIITRFNERRSSFENHLNNFNGKVLELTNVITHPNLNTIPKAITIIRDIDSIRKDFERTVQEVMNGPTKPDPDVKPNPSPDTTHSQD